eukprot:jgi/Chrzof1/2274/Cz11g09140.t1
MSRVALAAMAPHADQRPDSSAAGSQGPGAAAVDSTRQVPVMRTIFTQADFITFMQALPAFPDGSRQVVSILDRLIQRMVGPKQDRPTIFSQSSRSSTLRSRRWQLIHIHHRHKDSSSSYGPRAAVHADRGLHWFLTSPTRSAAVKSGA